MSLRSIVDRLRGRHREQLVREGLRDQQVGEPPLMPSEAGLDEVLHVDDYVSADEHVEHEHPPGTPE